MCACRIWFRVIRRGSRVIFFLGGGGLLGLGGYVRGSYATERGEGVGGRNPLPR